MNADEIVGALRKAQEDYKNDIVSTGRIRIDAMARDCADLIESLQAQLAKAQRRADAAVEELEAEGEALDALKNNGFCDTCTGCHAPHDPNTITWCESWQWRGPQEAGKGARGNEHWQSSCNF